MCSLCASPSVHGKGIAPVRRAHLLERICGAKLGDIDREILDLDLLSSLEYALHFIRPHRLLSLSKLITALFLSPRIHSRRIQISLHASFPLPPAPSPLRQAIARSLPPYYLTDSRAQRLFARLSLALGKPGDPKSVQHIPEEICYECFTHLCEISLISSTRRRDWLSWRHDDELRRWHATVCSTEVLEARR